MKIVIIILLILGGIFIIPSMLGYDWLIIFSMIFINLAGVLACCQISKENEYE